MASPPDRSLARIPEPSDEPDNSPAIAPTLAYDAACMNSGIIPMDRVAGIRVPTLVMNGSASMEFMCPTALRLAQIIPTSQYRELPGQRHDVDAKVLAPILDDFFCAAAVGVRS